MIHFNTVPSTLMAFSESIEAVMSFWILRSAVSVEFQFVCSISVSYIDNGQVTLHYVNLMA